MSEFYLNPPHEMDRFGLSWESCPENLKQELLKELDPLVKEYGERALREGILVLRMLRSWEGDLPWEEFERKHLEQYQSPVTQRVCLEVKGLFETDFMPAPVPRPTNLPPR